MPNHLRITERFMVAGEGATDQELFRHLCANRGVAGYQFENFGGIGNLENWLVGLTGLSGFDRLRLLFVVADCDESPADRMREVGRALKKAKLPRPNNAFELANPPNQPAVMVILLPFTPPGTPNHGCVETLLLQSARAHLAKYAGCADAYCECVESNRWQLTSHVDKLRLRVLLSGAHENDPNLGLLYAIAPEKNLIPLGHECFSALAEILRDTPGRL